MLLTLYSHKHLNVIFAGGGEQYSIMVKNKYLAVKLNNDVNLTSDFNFSQFLLCCLQSRNNNILTLWSCCGY